MGDFGSAQSVETHQALTPADCPQQYDPQLHGSRNIPSQYTGAQQYEVSLPDYENNVLGIDVPLAFSTRNPMQVCNNLRCDNPISTGFDGANQAVIVFLDPSDTGWYGFSADGGTGTFYTDPYGKRLVDPGAARAVRQYLEAGVQVTSGFGNSGLGSDYLHTYGPDAWRGLCAKGARAVPSRERPRGHGGDPRESRSSCATTACPLGCRLRHSSASARARGMAAPRRLQGRATAR